MNDTIEIKQQVKEALFEFFSEEQPEYLRDTILEVIEDIGLGKAMEQGDKSDFVDENEIMELLK